MDPCSPGKDRPEVPQEDLDCQEEKDRHPGYTGASVLPEVICPMDQGREECQPAEEEMMPEEEGLCGIFQPEYS